MITVCSWDFPFSLHTWHKEWAEWVIERGLPDGLYIAVSISPADITTVRECRGFRFRPALVGKARDDRVYIYRLEVEGYREQEMIDEIHRREQKE